MWRDIFSSLSPQLDFSYLLLPLAVQRIHGRLVTELLSTIIIRIITIIIIIKGLKQPLLLLCDSLPAQTIPWLTKHVEGTAKLQIQLEAETAFFVEGCKHMLECIKGTMAKDQV